MGSRGDGDQVCDGRSTDDAPIEGRTVYDQELDLDRFGSLFAAKGDDELNISLGLCGCTVESLEIGAHVRCQVGLVKLQ
ncbi:hypothetical protein A2U01_0070208, partial [Trifolium medium]|nr:hypothetical protein [Trifolium medium]